MKIPFVFLFDFYGFYRAVVAVNRFFADCFVGLYSYVVFLFALKFLKGGF